MILICPLPDGDLGLEALLETVEASFDFSQVFYKRRLRFVVV